MSLYVQRKQAQAHNQKRALDKERHRRIRAEQTLQRVRELLKRDDKALFILNAIEKEVGL